MIGLVWLLYQPPTMTSFPRVGPLPVITYMHQRNVIYDMPSKAHRDETALLLKYYTRWNTFDEAAHEAEYIAPALFATADCLGVDVLRLQPSDPVLVRAFPLAVVSWTVNFRRDSAGVWGRTLK